MKRLTITYGDSVLCDSDEVGQLQLSESDDGISVTVTFRKPAARRPGSGSGSGGLLTMLASAGKSVPPPRRPQPAAPAADGEVG